MAHYKIIACALLATFVLITETEQLESRALPADVQVVRTSFDLRGVQDALKIFDVIFDKYPSIKHCDAFAAEFGRTWSGKGYSWFCVKYNPTDPSDTSIPPRCKYIELTVPAETVKNYLLVSTRTGFMRK